MDYYGVGNKYADYCSESLSDEMQTVMMNRMDDKELEKKVESDFGESDQETNDALDSNKGSYTEKEVSSNSSASVKNTVHVQHAHSFPANVVSQTTALPRTLSEHSRLRILTRAAAVQSMSSTPSEESNEDVPLDSFSETRVLQHQTSSKDADSESGPSSLSSSRDSSFDYTDSTGTDLNEFILKTLKNQRDKKMLLKLEKDFLGFISDPRKVLLQYPPMTSYHRMIVHRVAAYFGLDHNVDSTGKCIIVNKCHNTRFPEHRFTDLVREDSEEDPLPKLILKRQNSLSDESGPPMSRGDSYSRRSMEGKKSKSIEEREEEYKKARSRIFNHGSLSSQSSASSKDGESLLPAGLTDVDSENEKSKSIEYSEGIGDATVDMPQPAVRVLTNRSRSPEDLPILTLDVSSSMDASSSASSAALTTTVTESNSDSSFLTRSMDATTVSVEGAPYITRNVPAADLAGRSNMVEMIPQLSPNQTGGVVWTLPENQVTYPPGQGPVFPVHETAGGQMLGPDGFQPSAVGMQQGVAPTFFFPNQPAPAGATYQGQPAPRQPTPPLQQSQGGFPSQVLPVAGQFVNPATFPVFPPPRIYNQQDLEMLPAQQNNAPANAQGVITSNTGSPSLNYQELNNRFAGMSMNPAEQQENPGLTKQRGVTAFSPNSTQTFPSGQTVQFVVYRNISGALVMTPVSNHSQVNPAYVYSSPTPHTYTQQGYNPQMVNQVYTQQHFNQGFPSGEQTLLPQGSHTPPTPPQGGSPLNTNPGFMQHVQAMPVNASRPQMPTPVLNPGMLHTGTRLMNPYGVQAQQVVHIPPGQQLFGYAQVPYGVRQNRPNIQQSSTYKAAYPEKRSSKSNDIYIPESSNTRRPSPSDSPRVNTSSGQNRRSSGGSGKGHGKSDVQRSQYHQNKGKQKHKKSQHKHGGESSRKQYHSGSFQSGSSSLEMEHTTGHGSCVLEVYDVILNSRDQHQVVDDLLQAGAKISWNEKTKQSGKTLTAKATFNSYEQAEQALMTNTNPNYKLRRCPADIPFLESQNI